MRFKVMGTRANLKLLHFRQLGNDTHNSEQPDGIVLPGLQDEHTKKPSIESATCIKNEAKPQTQSGPVLSNRRMKLRSRFRRHCFNYFWTRSNALNVANQTRPLRDVHAGPFAPA